MSTEQISLVIGFLTVVGGGVSALFGKFALWVQKRIEDCEEDRQELWTKIDVDRDLYMSRIESLHSQLSDMLMHLERVENHIENIDKRNGKIDNK